MPVDFSNLHVSNVIAHGLNCLIIQFYVRMGDSHVILNLGHDFSLGLGFNHGVTPLHETVESFRHWQGHVRQ